VLAFAASLVILGAAASQLLAGAYEMGWKGAVSALIDRDVWGHSEVFMRLVGGDALADRLGMPPSIPLSTATLIVWTVRMPRLIVGALVGINLAVAGTIFQATTRNEMASPYTLGVSAGSGLAVLLVMSFFPSLLGQLPILASLGGGAAFLVVYAVAWKGGTSPLRLILAGVVVGAVAGSLQTGLFYLLHDTVLVRDAVAWTAGSLAGVGWSQVRLAAPWTLVIVACALASSRYLDLLLLGDAPARAVGLHVERVRFLLSAAAVLAAGTSISVAGHVGFVGLIVPHIVRNTVGSRHRPLLLACLVSGPALVMAADAVARLLVSPAQLPVGVITGLMGGVYFLALMRRQKEMRRA
jgi:iron complex transport system permease protein